MSITGQQIAHQKRIAQHKNLINFINQTPAIIGVWNIPYNEKGNIVLTQNKLNKSKNPFLTPNHPTYLLAINNPLNNELKQKIESSKKEFFLGKDAKYFFVKPEDIGCKIATTYLYSKTY